MRKSLYIFGLLSDEDISWVAAAGERLALPDGGELIAERSRPGAVFLLTRGKLQVTVGSPPKVVAALGPGELLGEVSFVDSRPATATVTAVGPAAVLRIDEQELRAKLDVDDAFAGRFYRAMAVYLATRLRTTMLANRPAGPRDGEDEADELSDAMLDDLAMAGKRVEWLLARVAR